LTTTWATSPATAQATRMAAILMAENATYWPETIRALMVHSAEWTPRMQDRFKTNKGKKKALLLAREFGYGVPNLDRALHSARSDLAIISQATIQPFHMPTKTGAKGQPINDGPAKFRHLHLYRLPWPVEVLEALGEKHVELKVTLSYFIEPSPGQFAPKTPALYRSHGVRFDLRGRLETEAQFLARINSLAAVDEADDGSATSEGNVVSEDDIGDDVVGSTNEPDDRWRFGSNSRNYKAAGSLHCDVWQGPGADLAARRTLAVYPVSGWWKTRAPKKRYNSKARYALIMTLKSLEQDVDLHTPVDVAIKTWIDQNVDI
jgi:Subtilase family